jgi:hypothetical protein
MKNLIMITLILVLSAFTHAEEIKPLPVTPAATEPAQTAVAPQASVSVTPAKKLTVKQKIQKFWNKISKFDFESLNIVGKTEKFIAGKKKQNVEAMEGAETGIWKHTKRMPTSGKAKEIADQLDRTTQEKIKKYDSLNSY